VNVPPLCLTSGLSGTFSPCGSQNLKKRWIRGLRNVTRSHGYGVIELCAGIPGGAEAIRARCWESRTALERESSGELLVLNSSRIASVSVISQCLPHSSPALQSTASVSKSQRSECHRFLPRPLRANVNGPADPFLRSVFTGAGRGPAGTAPACRAFPS
jgi:hypothetical protein